MKKLIVISLCVLCWSCTQNMDNPVIEYVQYMKGEGFFYCIDSKSPTIQLSWDYPVKPGTDGWKKFQTHQEMADACQIPKKILSSLSTKELAAICLQYPLLIDMFAFNIPDDGIDAVFNDFNGIRELFTRDDAAEELLGWYNCQIQNCSLLKKEDLSDFEKGDFIISTYTFEYLLSRAPNNYRKILQSLVVGYENQLEYSPEYISSLNHNFFARAHIINKMCETCFNEIPEKGSLFAQFYFKETSDVINNMSYHLIK